MKPIRISTAMACIVALLCTGCAHTPRDPSVPDERGNRTRTTLLVIGAAVVAGAVLASKAKRNTRDSIRDAIVN
ncbi:MAG: hypothetical protein AAGI15_00850 [Pseudomonadota bacterium]